MATPPPTPNAHHGKTFPGDDECFYFLSQSGLLEALNPSCQEATPTPVNTPANTVTPIPTRTVTQTATITKTFTPNNTPVPTATAVYTETPFSCDIGTSGLCANTPTRTATFTPTTVFTAVPTPTQHKELDHKDAVAADPVLGDLIYANSTPKWTKLAGQITTTTKALIQTGDGALSAAPSWGELPWASLTTYPSACSAGSFVSALADSPTCTSNASTATALAANGTNCSSGSAAAGVDASGNAETCIDHGGLGGLSDDDHTQYALLAGRSGGQTLNGDTAAGGSLTLKATANATKGGVISLDDRVELAATDATYTAAVNNLLVDSNVTLDFASASYGSALRFAPTITLEQAGSAFGAFTLFNNALIIKNVSGEANNIGAGFSFVAQPTFRADTQTITVANVRDFISQPTFDVTNSGVISSTAWDQFYAQGSVKTGATVTTRRGFHYLALTTKTGTVTNQYGIDIDANTDAATTNVGIRNNMSSRLVGGVSIGADTAATGALDVGSANQLIVTTAGLVSKYNNISTVSNGVPAEYATVDLTGQTAAKSATTIYTPAATGMFRVSVYLQITTAAAGVASSSILGGATGVVITYNDGDGNVAQSDTVGLMSTAGTIVTTSATNTTATNLNGTTVIYARTGVAIQYAIGYTSVGTTPMAYAAHLKVEAL